MEQRKRADLSLLAFLRIQLGWSKALPDAARKRIAEQAKDLVAIGEAVVKQAGKAEAKRKPVPEAETEEYLEWAAVIEASLAARAPYDAVEAGATKEMERLARTLQIGRAQV